MRASSSALAHSAYAKANRPNHSQQSPLLLRYRHKPLPELPQQQQQNTKAQHTEKEKEEEEEEKNDTQPEKEPAPAAVSSPAFSSASSSVLDDLCDGMDIDSSATSTATSTATSSFILPPISSNLHTGGYLPFQHPWLVVHAGWLKKKRDHSYGTSKHQRHRDNRKGKITLRSRYCVLFTGKGEVSPRPLWFMLFAAKVNWEEYCRYHSAESTESVLNPKAASHIRYSVLRCEDWEGNREEGLRVLTLNPKALFFIEARSADQRAKWLTAFKYPKR